MNTELTSSIWEKFSAPLRGYLVKKTNNSFAADDLLQEVFIRIHQKSATLHSSKNLRSWVYTIAHHVLMDYFRKNKTEGETSLPEDFEIAGEETKADMRNCIHPFIERLPEPYRSTLRKTEFEGIKHQVIAAEEGVSLSAVKTRVQRGREMIRNMFVACCHFTIDKQGKLAGEHQDPAQCSICNAPVS
ncbi:MAG: sigma-70 family RNA polymerase sigma factor [Bacteroidia bacterium]|nr:sigma-70 family RNA polymerase sigma factor [Bacteroidia bacterium]